MKIINTFNTYNNQQQLSLNNSMFTYYIYIQGKGPKAKYKNAKD